MKYELRKTCVICKSDMLIDIFSRENCFPIGNFVVDSPDREFHFIPYNIQSCKKCKTTQTKYLGDLNLIYENNFAGAYGSIRSTLNELFSDFILVNKDIKGILEVGAGNGSLSEYILEKTAIDYMIVDPSYAGPKQNRKIKDCFFEEFNEDIDVNTIVMSQVFEHFYEPTGIIEKIKTFKALKYIYISWPDLESFIKNNVYHVLNPEHTFYIENQFLIDLFRYYNFSLGRTYYHKNHSVFFEFTKNETEIISNKYPENNSTLEDTKGFFERVIKNIEQANKYIDTTLSPVYVWPCSMHTLFCLSMGLNVSRISNVLDNSPLKINKYLYGYKLKCLSFSEIVSTDEEKVILLTGGCYNNEIYNKIKENKKNTIIIL